MSGDEPARQERIQKVLAKAGLASRREAERWLAEGRITVNGSVITQPGTRVDISRDHVKVDGKRIRAPRRHVYYLLNKPDGCVTTARDPQGRPAVGDLLRGIKERVFPVGRLDYHTTGLLLLTNDGDLAEKLMRPGGCAKTYHVKVRGRPTGAVIKKLERGFTMGGRRTLPCTITLIGADKNSWLEVTLLEGRRNQIRRMFASMGHPVANLKRVAIGPLRDRGLGPGTFRTLTASELERLTECAR